MAREVKLLKKCLSGDQQAFELIVTKYQDLVCAITFSATTDVQQSEELAQQTFVNAWKNLSQLKELASFRPWLCTIARNNIRTLIRKNQRDIIAKARPLENINDPAADEPGPLDSAIKKEHEQLVSDAIQRIDEKYREPLVLYYRQQQSIKQVALSLDLSEDAVKQRLHRARKMIKEQLSSIVEQTLSTTGPKKAFTTAVVVSIAGIAAEGSAAAAAAGITTASSTTETTTALATTMSGVTVKIIAAVAAVAIGFGAVVAYRLTTKPSPEPEFSQGAIVAQEHEIQGETITELTAPPTDNPADLSSIDKPKDNLKTSKPLEPQLAQAGIVVQISEEVIAPPSDQATGNDPNSNLETDESPAPPAEATDSTISMEVYVVDDKTENPLEGVQLRVNRGDGCGSEPDNYLTDDEGFYLIEFKEGKPTYLSILASKAGYVPMQFAWQDKMLENLDDQFAFYLPKGKTIGGVIQDANSQPILSATVIVNMHGDESKEYPWARITDYTVTTDPNGRWQCDILPAEPRQFSVKLSHPEYADTRIWVNDRDHAFAEFYNNESVLVMTQGTHLHGWVIDSEAMPIEGATVLTGESHYNEDAAQTTTDSQGHFEFPHYMPQWPRAGVTLTVQAQGYAPELEVIPFNSAMEPATILLSPPNTIRGRVIDVNGNPLSDAGVAVEGWRDKRTLSWRSSTDPDGRFLWDQAPQDEVRIDIFKEGYMRVADQTFVASDQEYDIVMSPALLIRGTVVDADSNEPIDSFTANPGIQWDNDGKIRWQTGTFSTKDFTDGEYEISITYPYPGHLIRIDADGYLPAKSRIFDSNEGSVTYDFQLIKGAGPGGIVYDPNGSPAPGAQIYIVAQNKYFFLENGKPSNRPKNSEWAQADEDGAFSFTDLLADSLYKLVVLHDTGFTEVTKQQWLTDPNITLQQWGRVEGTVFSGLGVAANQTVKFYSRDTQNNPDTIRYSYSISAKTDDNGDFVIDRALPGRAGIGRTIVSLGRSRTSYVNSEQIQIVPGETTTVEIGGGGRPVTGSLIIPEWATDTVQLSRVHPRIKSAQSQRMNRYELYADMEFPKPQGFDQMTVAETMQWYQQQMKSDDGAAFRKEIEKRFKIRQDRRNSYNVMLESDGSFRIVDALPGEYVLSAKLHKASARGHADYKEPIVAEIKHTFTVGDITEENQDIPVELGTIEFTATTVLEPNTPAPDFTVPSLDGGTLSLTDYRGKYLLLTFYMITDQESLNEDMADLKRIQDDFPADDQFAMLGLTTRRMAFLDGLTEKFLLETGLTWHQGMLDSSNYELKQTYHVRTNPASFFIDPNGILLTSGLKGEELYETVATTLANE